MEEKYNWKLEDIFKNVQEYEKTKTYYVIHQTI